VSLKRGHILYISSWWGSSRRCWRCSIYHINWYRR